MEHLPIGPKEVLMRCGDCTAFSPYLMTENGAVSVAKCPMTGLTVCNCDNADWCPVSVQKAVI